MFYILGIMFCGMAGGYLLRRRTHLLQTLSRGIMPVICLLLFLMGVTVGRNAEVMDNLASLGVEALLLTLGSLAGSILLARYVYARFFHSRADHEK